MFSLKALLHIVFPEVCLTCQKPLHTNEHILCTICSNELPKTNFINYPENQAEKIFYGRAKIEQAAAYLWYNKKDMVQELIFQLKYRKHEEIGALLAHWIVYDMKQSERFKNIDCITPVPMHPKKLQKRGYNQLSVFGKILADELGCDYDETILIKTKNTVTQTKAGRTKRWENVQNVYALAQIDTSQYEGKHILVIDDVLTTGATLEACTLALQKIGNVTISIFTIAIGA